MAVTHTSDKTHVLSAEKAGLLPAWVNPDLNRLMVVKKVEGDFRSWAESLVDLPAGTMFARITGVTTVSPPSWSSVQAGRNLHLELNSNLVFINHSCAPTLEWDMEQWRMAQPFDCWCGAAECFGRIEGAASFDAERLDGYWINRHIREMLDELQGKNGINDCHS
ncbi:hypothetical protein ONZ43_g3302 [Nemania bipapillata]|uniref:Uncharacterized protein n=1 Tax=Nemania bipapillata TaxID=110536 RepID=A0ACC2IXJ1_9PEZI|nr:hypothetical protein ONZ43_g3302 [Nemania bipapillata]